MGYEAEQVHKLLKAAKSSSRNRVQAVADYGWKYGDTHHKDLVHELDRFIRKARPDTKLAGVYIVDLLCMYEENRRERERQDQPDQPPAKKRKKKPNPFRPHYDNIKRLQDFFPHALQATDDDLPRVYKVIRYWLQHPWLKDECKAYLKSLLPEEGGTRPDPPAPTSKAASSSSSKPHKAESQSNRPPAEDLYSTAPADPSQFDLRSPAAHPEPDKEESFAPVFDYDDDSEDEERRIELQRKQLEEEKRRLSFSSEPPSNVPSLVNPPPNSAPPAINGPPLGLVISFNQDQAGPGNLLGASTKLLITGLPRHLNEPGIADMCSRFGRVLHVFMVHDGAIVTFSKRKEAELAFSEFASSGKLGVEFASPDISSHILAFDPGFGLLVLNKASFDAARLSAPTEHVSERGGSRQPPPPPPPSRYGWSGNYR